MNKVQVIHRALAAGNVAVLLSGLAAGGSSQITLVAILTFFLLVILRIKFWFDDEQYFEDVKTGKLPGGLSYYFGCCVAGLSWLVWYLAGIYVKNIEICALCMSIVILLSTVWIIAAIVRRGAYGEQIPWLFFNAFYLLGFSLLFLRGQAWNSFRNHPEKFTIVVIAGLLLVVVFDFVTTRLLEYLRVRKLSSEL